MAAPPLLAILLVTSSDLTSHSRHVLFHHPPHPTPTSFTDEEVPDDSSSNFSSKSSSSCSSSRSRSSSASVISSKYSRATADNNHYTIDEDEDQHNDEFELDEDDDRTQLWRRKASRTTEWGKPLFGLTKRDLADILIPKDVLCNRKFELGIDDLVFLGHPVLLHNDDRLTEDTSGGALATSPSGSINDDSDVFSMKAKVKLSKFHIVFVISPSWRLDYHEQIQKMYNEIIKKFTHECLVQQREKAYISLEAFKIHRIMREAEEKGTSIHVLTNVRITNVTRMGGNNTDIKFSIRNIDLVQLNNP